MSAVDIERLGSELDAIRSDIEGSLGALDAAYIRRTILFQRTLDVAARLLIAGTRSKAGWALGAAALGFAKSVENMEIGHNVSHGQWDWMNDPEIHSSTWEWDMVAVSSQWKYSHNYRHHVFSNVLGVDDDLGFGVMRVTRDQPWKRQYVLQPLQNLFLALTFEWGIAAHGVDLERGRAEKVLQTKALVAKIARQGLKDYVMWPALSIKRWRRTLGANAVANLLRNLWAYVVIFCGHFPDGTQKFTPDVLQSETRAEWYLRQMLGAANFKAGPLSGICQRQPVLPDRTSPVSRPAEQPPRRDRRTGAAAVCEIRPAVPHGFPCTPIWFDVSGDPPAGSARRLPGWSRRGGRLCCGPAAGYVAGVCGPTTRADAGFASPLCRSGGLSCRTWAARSPGRSGGRARLGACTRDCVEGCDRP